MLITTQLILASLLSSSAPDLDSGKKLRQEGKFEEAMTIADKIVHWEPHNGSDGIHQGFIAYLIGDKKKSRDSFQKAREIDPDGFQASWDRALCNHKRDEFPCTRSEYIDAAAAYAKVINDKDFVEQILD